MSAVQTPQPAYVSAKDNKRLDHLPGSYGPPLIGHTFKFLINPYGVLDEIYKTYGPISKISLTFQKMLLALGPDYIKLLMLDQEQIFSPRMGYDGPLGDFFSGGLLMRDFGEHKVHRRIMQTAFKTQSMRQYIGEMQPIIDTHLTQWGSADKFLYYPNIKTLLLDVGAKVFLGLDLGGRETREMNNAFLDMMSGALALVRKDWPGLLYRKGMNGRRWLEHYFADLVSKRRDTDGTDMASYFSKETDEDGQLFPDSVVADHLVFLLLAAHDTTTSALTMASYLLAHDQTWQERLRQQVRDLGRDITYDDLPGLTDIENVFKETLRMYPAVPQMMRRTIRDTEIEGFQVPAHTLIQVSPLYVHRMEEWWTNPHAFDPDRFAPGREEHKKHPFQWAPFGGGAHKCIGLHFADMLFKCVLVKTLSQYRFRFVDESQYPGTLQYFPFSKPTDNLPLVLEKL
ncbi:MAG: cytochrome P450 [Spongiibacteraceae bacterium]|jgi:cytochrome P450|nr:cytochrome P450 [Spongiibacteraceae bacterium]